MSDQSRRSRRLFVSRSMHALDRASAAERVGGEVALPRFDGQLDYAA